MPTSAWTEGTEELHEESSAQTERCLGGALCPSLEWKGKKRERRAQACQALIAPREVSGRVGQALTLNCWYGPGYQGYNKYWCRGASWDSCRKVVETAGREVPRQRGRVSITDNHVFCFVLLTLEELSEEDAGSYWCGVERAGRDIMKPVTVRVLPAPPRTTPDASVRAVPANPATTPSPWLSDATIEILSTANSTNSHCRGPPHVSPECPGAHGGAALPAGCGWLCRARLRPVEEEGRPPETPGSGEI
nr:CMRF35-like molecule 2 [Anas platyrhynchos]